MKRSVKSKTISYLLLFSILLGEFLFNMPVSYGANGPKVTITNIYTDFNRTEKRITIEDSDIKDYQNKVIKIAEQDRGIITLSNIRTAGNRVEADLDHDWIVNDAFVEGYIYIDSDTRVEKSKDYLNIGEAGIPVIENTDSFSVDAGEPIVLNISSGDPKVLEGDDYRITVNGVEALVTVVEDKSQIKLTEPVGKSFGTGLVNIEITKTEHKENEDYILEAISLYREAVNITGNLNIEGVTMFPTMGEPGSKVTFTRDTFPRDEYDIYFIKDLNNPQFTQNNMGKDQSINIPTSGETVITVEVPNLSSGPYHVIFTNSNSSRDGVNSLYVLPQQYQVVTVSQKPTIESIEPDSAPAGTPTRITINGNYFVNHNVPGFEPNLDPIVNPVEEGDQEATIDYGQGTLTLPNETGELEEYDVEVKRTIQVDIGQVLKYEKDGFEDILGDERDPNKLIVRTGTLTIEETQIEDIIIRLTTTITGDFTATMQQDITRENGFTYYPATETPEIYEVVPNIISIESINNEYYIDSSIERLLLTIEGENFLVTRYEENGEEKINYPKIALGGTIINSNDGQGQGDYKPVKFQVLNDGKLVDGTKGNEVGNRILIELEAGDSGFEISNINSRTITIQNPYRQSADHATEILFTDMVQFLVIDKNEFPVIDYVRPSLVSMDGGEEVTIIGSNFKPGAKVYIDNNIVENIDISGDMRSITFYAPPGSRPGETLLQVINPEGGIATHVFTYTETYTQPELSYINPKEGTTNTLVTAKGENFLSPDPTVVVSDIDRVDENLIYRLIGTRIFIDGYDINEYNRGEQNRIKLQPYSNGHIFEYNSKEEKVLLGEGYDSVILYDGSNNKFYAIRKDIRGNYSIEGGEGIRYDISYDIDEKNFYADEHTITMEEGKLVFNGLELQAYTPFKIDSNGNIVGNRVKFVDSNTLTFKVPNLNLTPWTGEGLYDVSIVNPDTKTETIKNGFYFFASSNIRPIIKDIVPSSGPDIGGNVIHIYGPEPNPDDENDNRIGFTDTGVEQTRVFIGGQEVPAEDVNILPGGREMEVKVPPTIEDIREKGTDRITVPIVLVNPNGGTFSISYEDPLEVGDKIIRGYTYLVPTSNPKINSISPTENSSAGGYILEIFGSDFRDFEPFTDTIGDGVYQEGMPYDDIDGNGEYTPKAPNTKETSKYNPEYEYLISPIFPRVYFGNKEAEVVEFGTGYLQVVVPPNEAGTVEVYVVNNDSGISNKARFTYNQSNPNIEDIVPSVGDIRGGTKIGIYGSNLEDNTLNLVKYNDEGQIVKETKYMPLVRFGNNTNQNLPRDHENSGVLRSNWARVTLDGGIEVQYNAGSRELTATLEENNTKYSFTYNGYTGEEIFINTKDFKYDEINYPYEQLIRLVVDTNRLIVTTNFAPETEYVNSTQVTAITPTYFRIGRTPVFVVNPDKSAAEWEFEFKYPDSNPVITNITKDDDEGPVEEYREEIDGNAEVLRVDYKGGNTVTINGTDFREGAIVKIEDLLTITEANIEYNLPNQITFTMPSIPEGEANSLKKVIVENPDGGVADSSKDNPPIYIEFVIGESNPEVYTVEPTEGPATGGTRIRITGYDFREEMEKYPNGELKVYFGDEKVADIRYIDYQTIEATAPESDTYGPVRIRVENPDGSITRDEVYFNYISKPRIRTTSPKEIFTNDTETEVTLTGDMFMPGAKVVVGGRIVDKEDIEDDMIIIGEGITGTNNRGENIEVAVVGGIEAAEVTVENENVIRVRFNEPEELENNHIIIINPDGGISDPYDDFDFNIPIPDKPLVLEGIPGYESTVQLIWSKSDSNILNRATRYEVYGKLSTDRDYTFIGDTEEAEFLVKGLKPSTRYRFMVRALNEYGAAIEYATVTVKTLGTDEDYKQDEKEEKLDEDESQIERKGKEEIVNGRVRHIVGSDTIRRGQVDFRPSKYKNYDKFTVSIPVEYARKRNLLQIKDQTMTLMIYTDDLYTLDVTKNDNTKDAYINIHIDRQKEYRTERGKTPASKAYSISFSYQYGKNTMDINSLLRPIRLKLDQDKIAYPSTRDAKLHRFNNPTAKYTEVSSSWTDVKSSGKYILLSSF